MVRTIVIPDDAHIELDIPVDYIGKKVEVTYSLLEEVESRQPKKTMAEFWGIFSDKTASDMRAEIAKSREERERNI